MKTLALFAFLLLSGSFRAQENTDPTSEFSVSGSVKKELKIALSDLAGYKEVLIPDVAISNHLGEVKFIAKNMKGVLLKDILASADFQTENPRLLSAFFITCIASDGYTVVYSWNELFNNETGNRTYLVTEKDGVRAADLKESILMVSAADFKTGRRYLKSLSRITVSTAGQKN